MKKMNFIKWLVLAMLTAWAVVAILIVLGENSGELGLSVGMCIVKVISLFSLCLLFRVAHACYKRGLFPDVFQKYIKWCNDNN